MKLKGFSFVLFFLVQKIDLMYAAFTGQPLDLIQAYTERDRYFSAAEVRLLDFNPYCSFEGMSSLAIHVTDLHC